jgi:hypothetical protein
VSGQPQRQSAQQRTEKALRSTGNEEQKIDAAVRGWQQRNGNKTGAGNQRYDDENDAAAREFIG